MSIFPNLKQGAYAHIDGKKIIYDGISDHARKVELLRNAKALLYPVKWEEPFGMVMIEAMSVGTPVIGFARGAVPEVVNNNQTGYVVKDIAALKSAVNKLYALPEAQYTQMRKAARQHVEANFTVQRMVDKYLEVYTKVIKAR